MPESAPLSSSLRFNPLSEEFQENPYPYYQRLREEDPVHRSWSFQPEWILTRYDDVRRVLLDREVFAVEKLDQKLRAKNRLLAAEGKDLNSLVNVTSGWLLFIDPPNHTRLRSLVIRAFTPRVVEDIAPQIQDIVTGLIDAFAGHQEVDVVRGLASPLPVIVIATMLGLPIEDQERLKHWAETMFRVVDQLHTLDGYVEMETSAREFGSYLRELIEKRENHPPRKDLLGALLSARDKDDRLSHDEIISFTMLLFSAGEETTLNLIGNGLHALLHHPQAYRQWQQEPKLTNSAVEEFLRFDSPVQLISRVAVSDLQLNGKMIKAGDRVVACLGAANRDPKQFSRPDHLDLARADNRHLAFGGGLHHCVGAPLARLEGQIALRSLLDRFPDMTLVPNSVIRRPNRALRGLSQLIVRLVP